MAWSVAGDRTAVFDHLVAMAKRGSVDSDLGSRGEEDRSDGRPLDDWVAEGRPGR